MSEPAVPCDNDYYEILGVSPSASEQVLKVAYRSLIKMHHPDAMGSAPGGESARRINEAYTTLRDPVARTRYDLERKRNLGSQMAVMAPPPSPIPGWSIAQQEISDLHTFRKSSISAFFIAIILFLVGAGLTISFISSDMFDQATGSVMEMSSNFGKNSSDTLTHALPPAPRMDDLEAGAFKFLDVFQKTGMPGARNISILCHKQVARAPSWKKADECASFDYAAAYVDRERSRIFAHATDRYFDFQREHQDRNYTSVGADPYSIFSRLKEVQGTIEFKIAEGSVNTVPGNTERGSQ